MQRDHGQFHRGRPLFPREGSARSRQEAGPLAGGWYLMTRLNRLIILASFIASVSAFAWIVRLAGVIQ